MLLNGEDYAGRVAFDLHKNVNWYAIVFTGVSDGRMLLDVDSMRVLNKKKPPTTFDKMQAPPKQTPETSSRQAIDYSIAEPPATVNWGTKKQPTLVGGG